MTFPNVPKKDKEKTISNETLIDLEIPFEQWEYLNSLTQGKNKTVEELIVETFKKKFL